MRRHIIGNPILGQPNGNKGVGYSAAVVGQPVDFVKALTNGGSGAFVIGADTGPYNFVVA
ncbi:14347_t:CDS:2 [Funneliformis geosporum]|nr:14347_t:CDS:2 [Funneliformis geosporum]